MELVVGRLLHPVEFVVLHPGKIRSALFHDDMAGCARAASAAGVFQMEAEVHCDIEQRFGFSMAFIRQVATIELECLFCWQERNFRHCKRL